MTIDYQQTDSAGDCSAATYCSGATALTPSRQASVGGTPGTAENSYSLGAGAIRGIGQVSITPASGVTWAAGDWTVRFNVTTSNMNVSLRNIYICRISSACVNLGVIIGSLTGLADAMSATGVKTYTISGAAQTPNAGDRIMVILVMENTNTMTTQVIGITPSEIITSPFTAGSVTHEGSVSESITLVETDAAAAVFGASRSEALTLAETNAGGLAFSVSREEAFALAETQTAIRTIPAVRSETLTLTDSQSALAVFSASHAEALALTDTETVLAVFAAALAETLAFADTDSVLATFQGVRTEAVSLVDSQTGELAGGPQEGSVSEALVLIDAVSAQVIFSGSLAEALALIEANSGSVLKEGSVSEALILMASEAGTRVIPASLTEQICVQSGEGTGLIISIME